ncbi:MAG: hypothetical protein ABI456_18870 [Ktedonobacteraceae bacterium]
MAQREMMLKLEGAWRGAKFNLRSIRESSPDLGEFAYYPPYAEFRYKELEELCLSGDYPQKEHAVDDDYIAGNVRITLWKVVERLITSKVFAPLRLASPFRVGYRFHDDGHFIVLRLLNWPAL